MYTSTTLGPNEEDNGWDTNMRQTRHEHDKTTARTREGVGGGRVSGIGQGGKRLGGGCSGEGETVSRLFFDAFCPFGMFDLGSELVSRSMFTDSSKNGQGQKLRSHTLLHSRLVNSNFRLPKNRNVSIVMIFRDKWECPVSPEHIIIDFGSTKSSKLIQESPTSLLFL